ncbi:MAG: hypothetical protein ACO1QB_04335 [Verrucomicrobiales bacterium]
MVLTKQNTANGLSFAVDAARGNAPKCWKLSSDRSFQATKVEADDLLNAPLIEELVDEPEPICDTL